MKVLMRNEWKNNFDPLFTFLVRFQVFSDYFGQFTDNFCKFCQFLTVYCKFLKFLLAFTLFSNFNWQFWTVSCHFSIGFCQFATFLVDFWHFFKLLTFLAVVDCFLSIFNCVFVIFRHFCLNSAFPVNFLTYCQFLKVCGHFFYFLLSIFDIHGQYFYFFGQIITFFFANFRHF